MSTKCQRCGSRSTLYLCGRHVTELEDMLTELPRLAAYLADAATGQTRLGERARRTRSDEAPMRVNLRASDLVDRINATVVRWAQQICEDRGLTYRAPRIVSPSLPKGARAQAVKDGAVVSDYDSPLARVCFWLAANVSAIACGEDAGDCFADIKAAVGSTLRAVNRPIPPRFCGPCPAPHPDDPARRCGEALMAHRESARVRCRACGTDHDVDARLHALLVEVDHWRFTASEILMIMETLGDPLAPRTFRHWRKTAVVKPAGWRRPDGRVSLRDSADGEQFEPMFRLSDVRAARTRQRSTRAAANE